MAVPAAIDSTNSGFDVAFGYDGQEMMFEALSGGRTRRYVHGPGTDEPLVAYLVTPSVGTSRVWYQSDERGSIVRHSNDAGAPASTIGRYDEYGAGGTGRFRYTGQYWLGEANLLYYRARIYDARLGRFLQPDPIGYGDGMNLYAYVGGDPVNFVDPTGTCMLLTYSMHYYSPGGDDLGEVPDSRWTERSADCFPLGGGAGGIFYAGGKGGVIGGDGGSAGMGGPQSGDKPCPGPLRLPSTSMMNEATSKALGSVPGGGRTSPLTSEFSKVTNLPNFRSGGWRPEGSTHSASAYEHDLGDTGKVVKVYIGDKNFNGANTATITDPTDSFSHYVGWLPYQLGMPVNSRNAAVYLSMKGC